MNKKIFTETELPMAQLQQAGLAHNGQVIISKEEMDAMLSGRRTGMKLIYDLQTAEGTRIPAIDAKLSLGRDEQGKAELRIHPIYHKVDYPLELTEQEVDQLISGQSQGIYKVVQRPGEADQEFLFEYDKETNEFIYTQPHLLQAPERVNDEELTAAQKELYRKGKEVELSDGTKFRYTGVDTDPVRSNRFLLIASILIDGGLTYLAFHGLKALEGGKHKDAKAALQSEGYGRAKDRYEEQEFKIREKKVMKIGNDNEKAYSRSGVSR
ncbi:MAG TPA: DUF4099 domain-containing protein [Pedobacter sp.]|uniref:DUF4099 domain-containing protein n=1 Tax=Pedobacter sp. TaxID=1411316 RepID=UPI002CA7A38D|nr:DUF4099 domain-containing protein [Pedobacter sp.]HMI02731.1 DUF4099 domain-containing protein [Pedobacter sp.]